MSATLNEYYSVSSRGYTKHPNIEVLGIEPLLPRATQSILSLERDFQHESVIQEEENQYEPLQPKQERPKLPSSLTARMMEREEVASVHLTPKCNTQSLTSSCINQSQALPQRGILKRSLMELQKKNISSQEDTNNDKQLYIELEKERRLRRELERHYKQLLSEMHKKERSYSVDLGEKERDKERTRQFSKRTLDHEKSSERLMSVEDIETQKDHKVSKTVKTVKLKIPPNRTEQQRESPHNNEQENNQQARSLQSSPKSTLTQRSAEQQAEYFREQREFQDGVISQMRHLNKRIEQIDHFLLEKQREQEMERLERIIQEKQRQIYSIEQENERLKGIQKGQANSQTQKQSQGVQQAILKNVTPTTLYFFLIILMAIVAMS